MDVILSCPVKRAEMRTEEVLCLIARLLASAEANGNYRRIIEILSLQSLAYYSYGNRNKALMALRRAFEFAEPEGETAAFIRLGEPMRQLVLELRQSFKQNAGFRGEGIAMLAFADRVLVKFTQVHSFSQPEFLLDNYLTTIVEPLTERELEVLHLLAKDASNQEIASRLGIAANTTRVHVSSIITKLGAQNRAEAVVRSQQLGLLP